MFEKPVVPIQAVVSNLKEERSPPVEALCSGFPVNAAVITK